MAAKQVVFEEVQSRYDGPALEQQVLDTVWLLLAAFVGRAVALRGLFIEQRRLHIEQYRNCLLYTSPSPRDGLLSRMPSSA